MGFKNPQKTKKKKTKQKAGQDEDSARLLDELGGSLVGVVDASFVTLRLQGDNGVEKKKKKRAKTQRR